MTNGHKKDCKLGVDIGGTFTDIVVEDTTNKNIKTIKLI